MGELIIIKKGGVGELIIIKKEGWGSNNNKKRRGGGINNNKKKRPRNRDIENAGHLLERKQNMSCGGGKKE